MASACRRLTSRASFSSIKSAFRSNVRTSALKPPSSTSSSSFALPTKSNSIPVRRFSLTRSPAELGCMQSLLPLHSAVAASRMTSCLSTTSRSCRALLQELGLSVPR
ncbi:protein NONRESPONDING TO OXYLIPINS 2, mitochondrial isoform X2 [Ziziphus jujuba]|uniref:Protein NONRESPONDING TO OXYLIPINS 2, mitochondrial isoform X2 n=1 Tax=Ziziphus jujuba TaxID=326968 RepID=A0A6P4B3I7_ZIZJJ|nr:protein NONRESPONDING TO OXYLIPINS 2, mitochondrial isoform X2 [Ziziphus jujuba]